MADRCPFIAVTVTCARSRWSGFDPSLMRTPFPFRSVSDFSDESDVESGHSDSDGFHSELKIHPSESVLGHPQRVVSGFLH